MTRTPDIGKLVDHSGGQQYLVGKLLVAIGQTHCKAPAVRFDIRHTNVQHFDRVIAVKFVAADTQQLARVDPVAGKKAVQCSGSRVPVLTGVAHENTPAAPSQDESGTQTSGPRTYDDYVIRIRAVSILGFSLSCRAAPTPHRPIRT